MGYVFGSTTIFRLLLVMLKFVDYITRLQLAILTMAFCFDSQLQIRLERLASSQKIVKFDYKHDYILTQTH